MFQRSKKADQSPEIKEVILA